MSNIEQNSDEWFSLRCGKFTGSRFADVLATSKKDGKPLKARLDLIWALAAERIQGYQPQGMTSFSLEWGKKNEDFARQAYELKTGEFVYQQAFIVHPIYDFVGISPDGLIGDEGGTEIKCPKSPEIHLQRFINGVPDEYVPQIQGSMWVTGRKWWDFISYDPDTAEEFKLLIIRVNRDEDFINKLEKEILAAEVEVCNLVNELKMKVA